MRVLLSLILLVMMVVSSAISEEKLLDKIVLVVNGKPVLKSEIELAKEWYGVKSDKEAAKKLIDQIILAQAAEKVGIHATPTEVDNAILRLARMNRLGSVNEFKKRLEERGLVFSLFKDLIKREIVISKFVHIYLKRNLFEGIEEGKAVDLRKIRLIYLDKSKPGFNEKYEILKKLVNKEPFDKLAKEYSDDPVTAEKGGLLGEVKKGDLVKTLDKPIWEHKVGDIFEIDTDKGVYFIKIESEEKKIVHQEPTGEEVNKKLQKEVELYLKKLKENAVVEYIDKSLEG
ncbi:MAG TPA: peptidylprolyl isomerase [Persephonella sp.]|uniref:SurA N-domain family n=1 Tax=Persephonella marina (strain DSM 14350 / EX-H1) TaxID=123214 RepID=C0QR67_PERMH|nr:MULTISPECIES: peptidylprolyl isomerase [Persephonella]ACO03575.1 SurA N- domain family [Persephonella marina EX-H1]HCB68910.1 peptidylprolyl isomerase [Persephonella sp.]